MHKTNPAAEKDRAEKGRSPHDEAKQEQADEHRDSQIVRSGANKNKAHAYPPALTEPGSPISTSHHWVVQYGGRKSPSTHADLLQDDWSEMRDFEAAPSYTTIPGADKAERGKQRPNVLGTLGCACGAPQKPAHKTIRRM